MNLFNKEKEFVLKLINGILLIWIIIAIVIVFSNIVNLVVKDPELTYDEYRIVNCVQSPDEDATEAELSCQEQYQAVEINNRSQNYYYYRSIVICLANILIVGSVIFILNRNDKIEPTKQTTKKNKK